MTRQFCFPDGEPMTLKWLKRSTRAGLFARRKAAAGGGGAARVSARLLFCSSLVSVSHQVAGYNLGCQLTSQQQAGRQRPLPVLRPAGSRRWATMPPPRKRPKTEVKTESSNASGSEASDLLPAPGWFDARRARCLTAARKPLAHGKSVVYWMHREQRCSENWAMLYAKNLADEAGVPLRVAFCLQNKPELGTLRRSGFMLKGLAEVEASLRELHIPFHLLTDGPGGGGPPSTAIPLLAAEHSAVAVVCDMSPLRQAVEGAQAVAEALNAQGRDVPLHQVDAHNVVPVWQASNKREVGARTLRKKIMSQDDFFTPFPALTANDKVTNLKTLTSSSNVKEEEGGGPQSLNDLLVEKGVDWAATLKGMDIDRSVGEVDWLTPGTAAGKEQVGKFIKDGRLKAYGNSRNDPNVPAQSDLSPYLNFGQLSAQWAALTVKDSGKYPESVKSFVEESVVRRELADNFCFYCAEYDSLDAAAGWARETLSNGEGDEREHLYSLKQLEQAETHEDLWNAGQLQLVRHGKMHGWVRMYWAKKILEWTPSPAEALRIGLLLNDKYSLDGQDPNGFTGLGWSIMGIHDMGWTPRPIFGKIRYMNYRSTKTKFDIHAYVNKFSGAADKATAAGGTPARPKGEGKSKGKGKAKAKK